MLPFNFLLDINKNLKNTFLLLMGYPHSFPAPASPNPSELAFVTA